MSTLFKTRHQHKFPFFPTNYQARRIYNYKSPIPEPIKQAISEPIPEGIILCKQCEDSTQANVHEADAIVISCIDLRIRDNIACQLSALGYLNHYDETSLAGASLAYNGVPNVNDNDNLVYPNWIQTLDEIIKLSIDLHDSRHVILIDHMRCGAFNAWQNNGDPNYLGSEAEFNDHKSQLNQAAETIMSKFGPNGTMEGYANKIQEVRKYIISINGGILVDVDLFNGGGNPGDDT